MNIKGRVKPKSVERKRGASKEKKEIQKDEEILGKI